MTPEELTQKAIADMQPEMLKAFSAVSNFGLKCLEAGIAIVKEAETARMKLAHPDDPKNKEL